MKAIQKQINQKNHELETVRIKLQLAEHEAINPEHFGGQYKQSILGLFNSIKTDEASSRQMMALNDAANYGMMNRYLQGIL